MRTLCLEGKRQRPLAGMALGICLLAAAGCSRSDPTPGAGTATYSLKVTAPEPVASGQAAKAVILVVPQGPYKINLEFPLRLSVSGPAAASPKTLELRKPQAAKLSENELRLEPSFTASEAGEHVFKGTLRFSVCTPEQCEIKTEELSWTAEVR